MNKQLIERLEEQSRRNAGAPRFPSPDCNGMHIMAEDLESIVLFAKDQEARDEARRTKQAAGLRVRTGPSHVDQRVETMSGIDLLRVFCVNSMDISIRPCAHPTATFTVTHYETDLEAVASSESLIGILEWMLENSEVRARAEEILSSNRK